MSQIILDGKLDDEAIDDVRRLEREMYIAGDSRADVLRRVLVLLWMEGVIDDLYKAPVLMLEPTAAKKNNTKRAAKRAVQA